MTKDTGGVEQRYNDLASSYDLWDAIPERLFYRNWRRRLWQGVGPGRILEIGVGTGKNMPYYPRGAHVTGIDISPGMLAKAADRAAGRPDVDIDLLPMDLLELTFESGTFDTVIGSFVLMVVPDPPGALAEVRRVCRPGGELRLLEFTRSRNRPAAFLQDLATPLAHAVYGARLNRDIAALVESSGFRVAAVEDLAGGVARVIRAAPVLAPPT